MYSRKDYQDYRYYLKKKILCACHIGPRAEHMGKSRTLYKIKEVRMLHALVKDVVEMVILFKMLACIDILISVSTDCNICKL